MTGEVNKSLPRSCVDQPFKERLVFLRKRVGPATSTELTALLIKSYVREHPEITEMDFDRIMALVAGGLLRLGYNPREQVDTLPAEAVERSYSGLTYNLEERVARTKYGEMTKPLTPTEGKIMGLLIASPERVIPHETILSCIGVRSIGSYERDIPKVYVCHLRQALRGLYEKGGENEFDYPIPVVLMRTGYMLTNRVHWRTPNPRLLRTVIAQPVMSAPQS